MNVLLHLPEPSCDLLPVHYSLFRSPSRVVVLVPKLGSLHAHSREGGSEAKFCIIQNVDSEADGLLLEIYNESLPTESTIVTCVHLDLRFTIVVFFNETAFTESFDHFLERGVKGQTHEDGCVFGFSFRRWHGARTGDFRALTTLD